jgi:uncharacterized protein DUF6325
MPNGIGPIEVLAISFPGSRFSVRVLDEVRRLVDSNVINIVDGLLIRKGLEGEVDFVEFDHPQLGEDLAPLAALVGDVVHDLVSAEDVPELAAGVEPGSSAALVVFEHEWAKPLRNAIADTGGVLVADTLVPGPVVDTVLDALGVGQPGTGSERLSS